METTNLLICPACGSMDILDEDVTIDGITDKWHVCQDCLFEWPVAPSILKQKPWEQE